MLSDDCSSRSTHVCSLRSLRVVGSLARIGPNHVLIDDPFTARRILETHSQYLRNSGFDSFKTDPQLTNVVAEQDPSKHDRLRRQVAAGVTLIVLRSSDQ